MDNGFEIIELENNNIINANDFMNMLSNAINLDNQVNIIDISNYNKLPNNNINEIKSSENNDSNEKKESDDINDSYNNDYNNDNSNDNNNESDNNNDNDNNESDNNNDNNNKNIAINEKFKQLFTTEQTKHVIKTKSKHIIHFNKKNPKLNISLTSKIYDSEVKEGNGIKCVILEGKEKFDIQFIFQKKGRYIADIYGTNNDTNESIGCIASYIFECEEDWKDGMFHFPNGKEFELRYKDFKCEKCSFKDNVFDADLIKK